MTKTAITCLVLTILGAVVALPLLAGTIKAREARLKAVDTRLERLEQLEKQLVEQKAAVAALEQQVLSVDLQWGRVWPQTGQTAVVNPQRGLIEYGIGTQNGLGNPNGGPTPSIHTFGINPDGTGQYLGEFEITAAAPNAATGRLTRLPLPGETDDWNQASGFRARTSVPPSYTATIDDLVASVNIAQQDLLEEQRRLERAQQQLADSQQVLAQRQAELTGDADAAEDAAASVAAGLVDSIAKTSAERDALMANVDKLRRSYRAKSKELSELLDEIRSLRDSLPSAS